MKTEKEVLIDFKNWLKITRSKGMSELVSRLIDEYEKSINTSSRRSERRANGSNSKAVELCCYCHARPVAYNSWLCQFCIDEYNKEKQSGSIASR